MRRSVRLSVRALGDLLRDGRGATALEFCLVAALISLSAILAFESLGLSLSEIFTAATNGLRGEA